MNTITSVRLLGASFVALFLLFSVSVALVVLSALSTESPSYSSTDESSWRQISHTSQGASDGIADDAVPTTDVEHDFFSTTCQLRSANFFNIKNGRCYSLLYTVNVPAWPLGDGSHVARQGYFGVSCDEPNGQCCGGVIRTQSEASSGTQMLPCWVSKDPNFIFVYFGRPVFKVFPTTTSIALMAVGASALIAFVITIVVIIRWPRAEAVRREFAYYGRVLAKVLCCCGGDDEPRMRQIALGHEPLGGGEGAADAGAPQLMVNVHGNQLSILDTAYASTIAGSLSDSSIREVMKEPCVVCLEALSAGGDSVALLPCGHMFHTACLNDVFNMRLNAADAPCCVCQRKTRLVDVTLISLPGTEAATPSSSHDPGASDENDSFRDTAVVTIGPAGEEEVDVVVQAHEVIG